jgi:hypothetical protein
MITRATTRICRRAPGLDRTIEVVIDASVGTAFIGPYVAPRVLCARDVTFEDAPFPCEAAWSEFTHAERASAIEALIEAFEAHLSRRDHVGSIATVG